MAMYVLRGIDETLWARVRDRASRDNVTYRTLLLALLELYADGRVRLPEGTPKRVVEEE